MSILPNSIFGNGKSTNKIKPLDLLSSIRSQFPVLARKINNKPLTYLDSTATSLKPQYVIEAMSGYYRSYTANVFRGIYKLSEEATAQYEKSRVSVARFINAPKSEEIIFTRNTSESLNIIYYCLAVPRFNAGDEIITTILEHHSNFVPWQQLTTTKGTILKIWKTNNQGELDCSDLEKLITPKTRLLTFTAASNVTGYLPDVTLIVNTVRRINPDIIIVVDAAQAIPHMPVDIQAWGADFVAFSGHKMLGPTGIGVLWGKSELLSEMPPFLFGGDMIREVHIDKTVYNNPPHRFEAGTPHIAGAIGLGAAVEYLTDIGMDIVRHHEKDIVTYAISRLSGVKDLTLYGPSDVDKHGGVTSFVLKGIHPHDVAQILDEDNICIRVGFHCAQPLHEFLGSGPTARASYYVYTSKDDIDTLIDGLEKVKKVFR